MTTNRDRDRTVAVARIGLSREIDARVALRLGYSSDGFGWWTHPDGKQSSVDDIPYYSTDLAAAWTLVEHMVVRGYLYGLGNQELRESRHEAAFYRDGSGPSYGEGDTPAAAIVAAFLASLPPGGSNRSIERRYGSRRGEYDE